MLASDEDTQHRRLEPSSTPRVLTILSFVLEKLVLRNDRLMDGLSCRHGKSLDVFHGARAPNISILKLLHKYPNSLVVSLNVHRLLVTAVMVAAKMLDDVHYNNTFYARVGGVTNLELNRLEIELLFLLNFELTVHSRVFESYCQQLEKEMLLNSATLKIERPLISNAIDDVTEISMEDMPSSSPPQLVD
ncbi:Cyclin [Heracleum sosnowskyi]|uniref:Cyclin n=1 Tax=Heracleum sosnowskyi TaxID=360622 RepID=A0AAD8INQ2_9APIA|nr:Cyclin [Heracleum sosnowskyi]